MGVYYIKSWQRGYCDAFMDRYGVDLFIDVLAEFEKNGSLGSAMINAVKNQNLEKNHEENKCLRIRRIVGNSKGTGRK